MSTHVTAVRDRGTICTTTAWCSWHSASQMQITVIPPHGIRSTDHFAHWPFRVLPGGSQAIFPSATATAVHNNPFPWVKMHCSVLKLLRDEPGACTVVHNVMQLSILAQVCQGCNNARRMRQHTGSWESSNDIEHWRIRSSTVQSHA